MTDQMMDLRSLVEKAPDADSLREMIAFAASSGRSRKVLTRVSISSHRLDAWLFESPVTPIARTRSSTERVETP